MAQPDWEKTLEAVGKVGVGHVHLGLFDPSWFDPATVRQRGKELKRRKLTVTATAVGFPGEDYRTLATIRETGGLDPDARLEERMGIVRQTVAANAMLGVPLLSMHIGFIPEDPGSPHYRKLLERGRQAAHLAGQSQVNLLFETGQETAPTLVKFLKDLDCPNVGVNFDPANLILYGKGDPSEAVRLLKGSVRHVHAKDATASARPGVEWGTEAVLGAGQVNFPVFLKALKEIGYAGPLAIEREAGSDRIGDILKGRKFLEGLM